MKILPTEITPLKSDYLLQIQKKTEIMPPLSVGEEVEAKIVEKHPSGKMQILLKNHRMIANSDLQFQTGDKIAVRVAQLHPKVILNITHNKSPLNAQLIDHLRFYRSNPKALLEFFKEGIDRLSIKHLGGLVKYLEEKDVKEIQSLFKSLIFSKESMKNPFFLRDYVEKFGYLMEKGLGEALKKKINRTANVNNASQNLKGVLLKISDRIQSLLEARNFPAAEKLASFIRSSLKTIDSHQVINYQFQEQEGKYMFQIPLLFPEKMGLAEIFINFKDRDSKGKGDQGKKSALFLLNMDALGDVVVETQIHEKKIGCILKCEDKEACDFITPFLGELEEKLTGLGYGMENLKCVTKKENLKLKSERQFIRDSIDIKA